MSLHRLVVVVGLTLILLFRCAAPVHAWQETGSTVEESEEQVWKDLIYLPYKNLRDVLDSPAASVFVPYADYLKLIGAATGWEPRKVSAVITESEYVATVDGDAGRINATLQVQVFEDGWTQVPIGFGKAAIGKVTSENDQVKLLGTGVGKYALLFPEKGNYTVQLQLSSRIQSSPDGRRMTFGCPTVGITTFELELPAADQQVTLTPELVLEDAEAGEGKTRIRANVGATNSISALWHPRAGAKPQMDLLAGVMNYQQVLIEDGMVRNQATLEYRVLRGELEELRVAVPLEHRILNVSSETARIAGWKVAKEENRQLVVVSLVAASSTSVTLNVHTEAPVPDGPFAVAGVGEDETVHGIHSVDAVRESGQLVLGHGADVTLTLGDQQGLIRMEPETVHPSIRRPGTLAFKFYSPRFALVAEVKPLEPRVQVVQQTDFVFQEDELRLFARLNYTVERAGLFVLRLTVPENVSVDNVIGEAVREFAVEDDGGTLVVSLREKTLGAIALEVRGRMELEMAEVTENLELPVLEPVDVERESGSLQVYAPDAIDVVTQQDEVVGLQPLPLAGLSQRPEVRLASAWSYSRRPILLVVQTERRPARLSAQVATTVDIRQDATEVTTRIDYTVEFAGIDTFEIAVPEAIADSVNIFDSVAIKQKERAAEAVDGWVVWTIQMQRPITGSQTFEVSYRLPAAGQGGDAVTTFPIQPLQARGVSATDDREAIALSSVVGELNVLKDRAFSVEARSDDEHLERIDVRELNLLDQGGYLAFRYFRQPVAVELQVSQFEIQEVVGTVATRVLCEVVAGQDQWVNYRVRYRLRSSERQRLPLDLPQGAELLALIVDDQQIAPEKSDANVEGWDSYFVNVARTRTSDEAFYLTVQFRVPLDVPFADRNGGTFILTLPSIGGVGGGVVAQQMRLVLWMPEQFAIVGVPDEFERERAASLAGTLRRLLGFRASDRVNGGELDDWIGLPARGIIEFPTSGNAFAYRSLGTPESMRATYWNIPVYTWIVSGALFVIAWVLRKTSWENKFGMLLLAAFVAALVGVRDIDWMLHGLFAAHYGLIAMIVLWAIHSLVGAPASHGASALPVAERVPAVIPPPGLFDTRSDTPDS